MSSLEEYLDFIWEDTVAYVNLSIKSSDGSWRRSFAEWPRQRVAVRDFITKETAEGSEVFVSPSMWKDKPQPGQQYGKELFLGSHVLWAEFDGNAPEVWVEEYNNGSPEGSSGPLPITPPGDPGAPAADSGPPRGSPEHPDGARTRGTVPPSWVNKTSLSQNQHVYWKLDKILTDPDILENLNRTIASELGADNCWDATRVLRPPDTTNYGIGKPDRNGKTYPVRVEEANNRRYQVQRFRQTPDFRPVIRAALENIPDIREVLAKYKWDPDFFKAFTETPAYKKRSDVLMFLAYSAAESGFTDEEIYAVIRDADDRWEKYTGRLDRDKWLLDHVDRARAKHPLGSETLTFEGLLGTKHNEGTEGSIENIPDQFEFDYHEMRDLNVNIEWLLEGFLPKNGYAIIAGPNGIGKTQFGIRLCEAVVEGIKFLNWECKVHGMRAMFLSLEMERVELKEFYKNMNDYEEMFPTGWDRFISVPVGSAVPLDTPEGYRFLESKLEKIKPDLLMIDSLSVAMSGNFKDDAPVLKLNNVLTKIRRKFNVAIVMIHHNRKGQDKKFRYNELDDLYGSRFLPQDTASVIMMDKPKTLKGDWIAINPAKIRFTKNAGEFNVEHTGMNFINPTPVEPIDMPLLNFEKPKTHKPPSGEKL